jgi:FdhD protein
MSVGTPRASADDEAALPPLDPELPTRHVTSTRVITVRGDELEVRDDLVVGEEPLEIRAAGPRQEPVQVAVTMRTPGQEEELALGFMTSEGLLRDNEVRGVQYGDPGVMAEPDDSVLVRLARRFDTSLAAKRNFVATASCGICGKASIDDVAIRCEPLPKGLPVIARSVITSLPDALRAAQAAFERTGGLHAAGLFETDGRVVAVREDVGRHNALDKLIGSRVRVRELPLWDRILMVSGRVSFEIVQKAAVAGIPIVSAVSAPSSLAVEAAERFGMTLVGFVRDDRLNVYSGPQRVAVAALS